MAHTVVRLASLKSTGQVGQLKMQAVSVSSRSPFTGTGPFVLYMEPTHIVEEISFTESLLIINVDHNYKELHSKR